MERTMATAPDDARKGGEESLPRSVVGDEANEEIVIQITSHSGTELNKTVMEPSRASTLSPSENASLSTTEQRRHQTSPSTNTENTKAKQLFRSLPRLELQIAGGTTWLWVRRSFLVVFWLTWISLLASALVIIVQTPECKLTPKLRWWQKKPLYRIAMQSYYDTNGNGIGDLLGIQRQINYIVTLNVAAIIIVPIHRSKANTSDWKLVEGGFGNVHELKPLLKTAARSDIKIILDLTPNPEGIEEYTWSHIDFHNHEMMDDLLFVKGHISTVISEGNLGIQHRLFIMLFFTIPGTPIIYYGDEIGLKDYKTSTHPLMRWDNSKHAGFTKHLPWITQDLDTYTPTVLEQSDEPLSTLSFYQELGKIRTEEPSLQFGDFNMVTNITNLIAFIRQWDQTGILVVLNFGGMVTMDFTGVYLPSSALLLAKSRGVTPCQLVYLTNMKVEANTGYILKYFIAE
ncbi:amino acid transporter heavy chain SLC3A2-like [Heterodontus francisci]|uniref:amino acid transporter heavy chain SLC3A2-like n=1 Tax=Heterodontus francisci TaxID=7792 RepID=UPI00355BD146